jgi:hypothetical protein
MDGVFSCTLALALDWVAVEYALLCCAVLCCVHISRVISQGLFIIIIIGEHDLVV